MDPKDLVVGGLAVLVGAGLALAGAVGWTALFALPKVRWLEASVGRVACRAILAAIGVGLIVLGVLIARGVSPYGE